MSPSRAAVIRIGIVGTIAFAVAHGYWALGGTVGVPIVAPITGRPVFLAYDIAAAVVLIAAAAVAGRLIGRPTPTLLRLTLVGASAALLRGVIGLVQDTGTLAAGDVPTVGAVYDVWFAAVGALFVLIALTGRGRVRRRQSSS